MNLMSKLFAPTSSGSVSLKTQCPEQKKSSNSTYICEVPKILCHCREPDDQASGGDDAGNDDWIFNTIREKDLKKVQNGAAQPAELERKQVRPYAILEEKFNKLSMSLLVQSTLCLSKVSDFPFPS